MNDFIFVLCCFFVLLLKGMSYRVSVMVFNDNIKIRSVCNHLNTASILVLCPLLSVELVTGALSYCLCLSSYSLVWGPRKPWKCMQNCFSFNWVITDFILKRAYESRKNFEPLNFSGHIYSLLEETIIEYQHKMKS